MRSTRRFGSLALVAGWLVATVLMASPASADVNCSDLGSRAAAQTYYDGHVGDVDHLDGDGDGQACEGNASPHTAWTLVLLGVLFAAGLARYTTLARPSKDESKRESEERPQGAEAAVAGQPIEAFGVPGAIGVLEPLAAVAPLVLLEQPAAGVAGAGPRRPTAGSVSVAVTGSVGELARALRMVQYGERMHVLEAHAAAHGSTPQEVLDALASSTTDLELQGWALSGYDPPWTVRVMRCSCVDGLRNFQLRTAEDGSHFWACATCHQPVRAT